MDSVQLAIRGVYQAFRSARKPNEIVGCDCGSCLTTEELAPLLNSDRRYISLGQIDGYAENALGTIGSKEDFLYFLPRLLELRYVGGHDYPLEENLHRKLRRIGYLDWCDERNGSIRGLFLAVTQCYASG